MLEDEANRLLRVSPLISCSSSSLVLHSSILCTLVHPLHSRPSSALSSILCTLVHPLHSRPSSALSSILCTLVHPLHSRPSSALSSILRTLVHPPHSRPSSALVHLPHSSEPRQQLLMCTGRLRMVFVVLGMAWCTWCMWWPLSMQHLEIAVEPGLNTNWTSQTHSDVFGPEFD
ncbi:hypothetical protein DEU56DRAFT_917974 [Suillus clintonianus]|uniref:uncharacterized protein n=1 Tax=Suillus clintonianus TaxID=1904413 RepID=UPI001B86BDBC|nr:uncharacterized protein DEU56DRAFT_917974 [Suillus clintonianus]KAG2121974.1 hypothetical protein DEU56DRAFT_917974 [Suillus clintonianus]